MGHELGGESPLHVDVDAADDEIGERQVVRVADL